MAVTLRPAVPGDTEQIAALLGAAFQAAAGAPFTAPALLHWKYFESFGEGSLPRNHVLVQGQTIVAHCVAMPLPLCVPRAAAPERVERLSAVCFMDWVAGRELPGAGAILMKKLMSQAQVAVVAGGSATTRSVIPRLGFEPRGSLRVFARVLRPWRQARTRPSAGPLRDAARLARNTAWSRMPLGTIAAEWRAIPVRRFDDDDDDGAAWQGEAIHVQPTAAFLNYWLRCPAAQLSGFEIVRGEERRGRLLLSRVRGQTRLAGLWLRTSTLHDLQQAYRLATRAASQTREASEMVAFASTAVESRALGSCGFRERDIRPLFVHDPAGRLPRDMPLVWNSINDDAAYVDDPANPYRT
jgi:hypothetical protein